MNFTPLDQAGLNLQSVLSLSSVPTSAIDPLRTLGIPVDSFDQMLLIGHLGGRLWQSVQARITPGNGGSKKTQTESDPIDRFSKDLVTSFLSNYLRPSEFQIIYPGSNTVNLQALGELAGWHYPSPLKIGINHQWGTWFAYRVVVLCKSEFPISPPLNYHSPCVDCESKACVSSCPPGAVTNKEFNLTACASYRLSEHSDCSNQCLARQACPVGKANQYPPEQINYHYTQSLSVIREI